MEAIKAKWASLSKPAQAIIIAAAIGFSVLLVASVL